MFSRGLVSECTRTQPWTPCTPEMRPRVTKRCSSPSAGCPGIRTDFFAHGTTPRRISTDRLSDRSGLRGLAVAVDQLSRTVAQLGTDGNPMINPIQIDAQTLLTLYRDRIEETQTLDVTATARTARISSNEVVERTLFRTRSCKTNRYHFLLALIQILFSGQGPRERGILRKIWLCEVTRVADQTTTDKPDPSGRRPQRALPVSRLAPASAGRSARIEQATRWSAAGCSCR